MANENLKVLPFPEAAVREAIRECWALETTERESSSSMETPRSIMEPMTEMDSHGIVRCFVAISEATGIEIPESEAKDDDYHSLDDVLANLVPLAQKYFEKQKLKIAKRTSTDADSSAG